MHEGELEGSDNVIVLPMAAPQAGAALTDHLTV